MLKSHLFAKKRQSSVPPSVPQLSTTSGTYCSSLFSKKYNIPLSALPPSSSTPSLPSNNHVSASASKLYLESQQNLLKNYQAEVARQADLIKQLRRSNDTARSKNLELLDLLKQKHSALESIKKEKSSIQVFYWPSPYCILSHAL